MARARAAQHPCLSSQGSRAGHPPNHYDRGLKRCPERLVNRRENCHASTFPTSFTAFRTNDSPDEQSTPFCRATDPQVQSVSQKQKSRSRKQLSSALFQHDARAADHLHRPPRELCTPTRRPLLPTCVALRLVALPPPSPPRLGKRFSTHANASTQQLYLALFLQLIPLPEVVQTQIVPVLPFWFIVAFGAMLLARLGWGVLTFNDTPEAYKELMVEIEEAKVDLRRRGVDVD
ncbi:hypothetical protein RB601_007838 [Gaeumannomyces tritici]